MKDIGICHVEVFRVRRCIQPVESPFSFSALDIKTMAMTVLKTEFRDTTKRRFPKGWFGKSRHTHVAVDDAIEQGELFCNILKEVRG